MNEEQVTAEILLEILKVLIEIKNIVKQQEEREAAIIEMVKAL